MVKIAPSILAADFNNLEDEIKSVLDSGADYIHVDVMDGKFVNNKTPGKKMLKAAKNANAKMIDTHLMVLAPWRVFKKYLLSDIITFHIETVKKEKIEKLICKIKKYGKKVGIAIKPKTPVEDVMPFLNKIDMVLVMTVEPGFGGQELITECLEKVKKLRETNKKIDIEVDGGINLNNVEEVKSAGANVIVAGTAIFKSENTGNTIIDMKK